MSAAPVQGFSRVKGPESDRTGKASLARFTSFPFRSFMKRQAEWGSNPAVDKTSGNRPVCGRFIPVSLRLLWSSQRERRVEGDSSFSTSLSYSFISHSICQSSAVSPNAWREEDEDYSLLSNVTLSSSADIKKYACKCAEVSEESYFYDLTQVSLSDLMANDEPTHFKSQRDLISIRRWVFFQVWALLALWTVENKFTYNTFTSL